MATNRLKHNLFRFLTGFKLEISRLKTTKWTWPSSQPSICRQRLDVWFYIKNMAVDSRKWILKHVMASGVMKWLIFGHNTTKKESALCLHSIYSVYKKKTPSSPAKINSRRTSPKSKLYLKLVQSTDPWSSVQAQRRWLVFGKLSSTKLSSCNFRIFNSIWKMSKFHCNQWLNFTHCYRNWIRK